MIFHQVKFLSISDLPPYKGLFHLRFLSLGFFFRVCFVLILLSSLLTVRQALSEDVKAAHNEPLALEGSNSAIASPKPEQASNFLDRQHVFITDQFVDLNEALDRLLSNKRSENPGLNQGYLVLKIDSEFGEGGETESSVRLRAKVDLPHSKERFKLIFESDPEDDYSLRENERSGSVGDENLPSDRAIAGLEYVKKGKKYEWQPSIDVGTRLNFPVDLFTRVRLRKRTLLSESWELKTKLELPYFAREGAKPSLRLSLLHPINEMFSFKSISRYKYTRKQSLHEAYQSIQLNQLVNEKVVIEYKIGALGDNQTAERIEEYFVQIAYKKRIYRDWMFFTIAPAISYQNERDWSSYFSLAFQLQVIYSN